MASRRSHAPTNDQQIEYELWVPRSGTFHQKPTASCKAAQLWDKHHFTLSWFREAGPTIILNIIVDVSVPLRGTIGVGVSYCTHSCAASQLAVGFMI